jgi:hypothetical protein
VVQAKSRFIHQGSYDRQGPAASGEARQQLKTVMNRNDTRLKHGGEQRLPRKLTTAALGRWDVTRSFADAKLTRYAATRRGTFHPPTVPMMVR